MRSGWRSVSPSARNRMPDALARPAFPLSKNPKLNVNPQLVKWNQEGKLPALKFMRTLWVCEIAGGPFHYTGKDMHSAHEHLRLISDELYEVDKEIAAALDYFGVPEREKGEVLGAVITHKGQVVNG
jgi:hemoglobin